MFTPTTTNPAATAPEDAGFIGTPKRPLALAFSAMLTTAAFAAAVDARADQTAVPGDDTATGRAVMERGRTNQMILKGCAVGTGTFKTRVLGWTPNEAGTAWHHEVLAEITWTVTSTGRVVLATLVNGAAGTVRFATSLAAFVDRTPINSAAPLKSEPGGNHPCAVLIDTLGNWLIELESAIDSGGVTSFNLLARTF